MLKRPWLSFAVALLIIVGLWLAAIGVGFQPYHCGETQEQAEQEPCSDSYVSRATFPLYWLTEFTHKREGFFVAAFTLALVIVTIGLVWATISLSKATDELRQSGEHTERAIILVKIFESPKTVKGLYDGSPEMGVGAQPKVTFHLKNYGRSPALIREFSAQLVCLREPPNDLTYRPTYLTPDDRVLDAGETMKVGRFCNVEPPFEWQGEIFAVADGHLTLYFYGRVIYDDIFNKPHGHQWFWAYRGPHSDAAFAPDHVKDYNKSW